MSSKKKNDNSDQPSLEPPVDVYFMGDPACSPFGQHALDEDEKEEGFQNP